MKLVRNPGNRGVSLVVTVMLIRDQSVSSPRNNRKSKIRVLMKSVCVSHQQGRRDRLKVVTCARHHTPFTAGRWEIK